MMDAPRVKVIFCNWRWSGQDWFVTGVRLLAMPWKKARVEHFPSSAVRWLPGKAACQLSTSVTCSSRVKDLCSFSITMACWPQYYEVKIRIRTSAANKLPLFSIQAYSLETQSKRMNVTWAIQCHWKAQKSCSEVLRRPQTHPESKIHCNTC